MRMSAKAKGRRTITKAIEFFKEKDMIVDEVEMTGQFRKSKDLFAGLCTKCWKSDCKHNEPMFDGFDIIAIGGKNVWLVQVKTNKPPTQKSYIRFAKKFASRYIRIIAMTWRPKRLGHTHI